MAKAATGKAAAQDTPEAAAPPETDPAPEALKVETPAATTAAPAPEKPNGKAEPKAETSSQTAPPVDLDRVKAETLAEHVKIQEEFLRAEQAKWRAESEADPDLGGQAYTQATAWESAALRRFGSPALEKLLESTGFRDHREVRKLLAQVGKAMSPERAVFGVPARTQKPANLQQALYGDK